MNSVMRIQVRVINGASPEIKQIQAALTQLARSTAAAQAMMSKQASSSAAAMSTLTGKTAAAAAAQRSFARHLSLSNLEKYGKNLQWTGRQIEFNFTLPLAIAGAAAFKWAMDNQRAFTQVRKVYGDTSASQQFWMRQGMTANQAQAQTTAVFNAELQALERTFQALSNAYGVNLAEVNQIAGEWAAAGASGRALAESVKLTMEAMILGDMDAAKATESLIAIQAQYGADTKQLIDILGALNAVENQTGATMSGLIDAFARSAGAARTAGVDYRHLAAMIAALTPASGSATNAGNALKTILSRILAPTKDASDLMNKLGLNTKSAAWASKNGTERLTDLAKAFSHLTAQQKANVSAYVASRYQVNRFDVLMRELISSNGYYAKALDATSSKEKIAAQYQRELSTVLQSNPKRYDILKNTIKNMMTDAIIPFIPAILAIMQSIIGLGKAFGNLDPRLQKVLVGALVGVAVFGTLTRILGASILLFTRLAATLGFVARMATGLVTFKWLGALFADFGKITNRVFGAGGATKVLVGFVRTVEWVALMSLKNFNFMVTGVLMGLQGLTKGIVATVRAWPLIMAGLRTIPATIAVVFGTIVPIITAALGRALLVTQFFFMYQIPAAIARAGAAVSAAATRFVMVPLSIAFMRGFSFILKDLTFIMFSTIPAVIVRGLVAAQVAAMRAMAVMAAAWRTAVAALAAAWTMFPIVAGAAMAATVRVVRLGMATITLFMSGGGLLRVWKVLWGALALIASGGIKALARMAIRAVPILFGPWGIAAAAAVAIFFAFRDQIMSALRSAINGMGSLPAAIASIFRGVIRVIAKAIEIIRDLLSYLNPFQRHSPSLVDNVKAGVAVIAAEYAKLRSIGSIFSGSVKALNDFGKATARAQAAIDAAKNAEQRASVVAAAGAGAGRAYDAVVASMKQVKTAMAAVTVEYSRQQGVVSGLAVQLSAANAELDKQQNLLKGLQSVADDYQQQLQDAQDALSAYANAPLKGEKAMNQAILDNTVAQKRLQLQMMGIEDVTGPIDDVRNRLAMMQGEIETLRGTQADLRSAGGGSEILGVYDDQIKAIQKQQGAVTDQVKQYDALSSQLDDLDRKAQRLDLEKYLNFDSVHDQIELTIDSTKELTSSEILAGIAKQGAEVNRLQAAYNDAAAAVDRQQRAVDAAQAKADLIQAAYDKEKASLDALGDAYDALSSQYDEMERSLASFAQTADSAMQKMKAAKGAAAGGGSSPALDAFNAGGAGDFADAGLGGGLPVRSDWSSQVGDINALTDQIMKDAQKSFSDLDPFKGLKDGWNKAWAWVETNVGPTAKRVWGSIKTAFTSEGGIFDTVKASAKTAWDAIKKGASTVGGWLKSFWNLIGPSVVKIWEAIQDFGRRLVEDLGPKLGELFGTLKPLFDSLWPAIKLLAGIIGGALLLAISVIASVIANVLGPVFNMIVDVIGGVIDMFSGLITFLTGVFTGDFGMMWEGIKGILQGAWDAIWGIINGAGQIIWGLVKGIVEGIWNFFVWLYDVLVGHSVIPDLMNAIVGWFNWIMTPIQAVLDWLGAAWGWVKDKWNAGWEAVKAWFDGAWTGLKGKFNDALNWVKDIFGGAIDKVKAAWNTSWSAITGVVSTGWTNTKAKLSDAWTWVTGTFKNLFNSPKDTFSTVWASIKNVISDNWNKYIKPVLDAFQKAGGKVKDAFSGATKSIADVWGGIKRTVGDAIDWVMGKIDGAKRAISDIKSSASSIGSGIFGGFNWNFGFAKGGQLPETRVGSGFVTSSARAIVGEGSSQWSEFVIPTDPRYRKRAWDLWADLTSQLGFGGLLATAMAQVQAVRHGGIPMFESGGVLNANATAMRAQRRGESVAYGNGDRREFHFYGDLSFPNITSGEDAEEFIKNLESLAG